MVAVEARGGFGEGEAAREKARVDAQKARFLGAVQVEATGVVTFVNAERNDRDAGEVSGVEAEEVAAGGAVEVLEDGQGGVAD